MVQDGPLPDNVTRLPVRFFASAELGRVKDPEALIAAAAKVEGLYDHARAVREAIAATPLPSGAAERFAAIEGQIEALAKLIEHDALTAQGLGEIA